MPGEFNADDFRPWTVITGGSEGVGACFARRLAAQGVNLVLVARKPEALEETARTLRQSFAVAVKTLSIDLGTAEAAGQIAAACADLEVGGLICNAGSAHGMQRLLDQPLDRMLGLMRLNVETPARLVHHFAQGMRRRGRGAIIFMGSGAGAGGSAGLVNYAAAKAYLRTFAEGLWQELRPHGVKVICLVLGLTRTPAMIRAGLVMEGGEFKADDPDLVARTGLTLLGDGPVHVMDSIRPFLEQFQTLPRRDVVEALSRANEGLLARTEGPG
ncbi:MAG: SDR family NAD(P)-dependent oxidoreductase [Proteobacteria bacterium]|nr:SDR family NAD(P)-dependent oxidoreductase [Pseudomonadota bacterium]